MINRQVGLRYARALLGLAGDMKELEKIDNAFAHVCELLTRHPEISHLLLNSTISSSEKEDFIGKVFSSPDIPRLLINFIKVLIQKHRFSQIQIIQEQFHQLFEKKHGIQEVQVVTATRLSAVNEEGLKEVLKKKLQSDIRLIPEQDATILGGMILRFNGTEIDASYQNRLAELRQKLVAS